jgi:LCP family protein required for cell wall assembly
MPSTAQPPPGSNGAPYMQQPIRQARRAWYTRKRVLFPLLYLCTIAATVAVLGLNIPVINILTGERETYGTQVARFAGNIMRPAASLDVAFSGHRQVWILLAGLDYVPEKTGEEPPHRSDSVMVAATDFDTKQIRILSIPRDSWVEQYQDDVPQGRDKLAHSYTYGGVARTENTVEHLLSLDTDFYVTIKFEGLARVIDALGGLEVDVEKDMKYDDRHGNLHINFKKGLQHLNGEQVVQYARFRHDAMSDIARMGRQQKVMQLLLTELMKPENMARLPQIAALLMECVDTNLTSDQLLALAQHAKEFKPEDIKTLTLNSFCNMGPGHVDVPSAPRGMSVQMLLDPDIAIARQFITDLQPPPPPVEPEAGTGIAAPTDGSGTGEGGAQQAPDAPAAGETP